MTNFPNIPDPERVLNPFRVSDERLQQFSDLWFFKFPSATKKQKDTAALAFVSYVLELGEEIARRFANGEASAYNEVFKRFSVWGNTQNHIARLRFWEELARIFPEHGYADDDLYYLTDEGNFAIWLCFVISLGVIGTPSARGEISIVSLAILWVKMEVDRSGKQDN